MMYLAFCNNAKRTTCYKLALVFSFLISSQFSISLAQEPLESWDPSSYYQDKCVEVSKFVVRGEYKVNCNKNYLHFNSEVKKHYVYSKVIKKKQVKIAGFNLWHLGSVKSAFKDFKIVASIMDNFDIVAATEILPVLSRNLIHNENIVEYLDENKSKLTKSEVLNLKKMYRAPGYMTLLHALRKHDKSWSLILSPLAESNKNSFIKEYTGFFYRGSMVKLRGNEHCSNQYSKYKKKKIIEACFPDLSKKFMPKDFRKVFSRRPFMSSFISGRFDFALISSHVVHTSPDPKKYPERTKEILKPTFNVNTYKDLDYVGITKKNFARMAEAKTILEFMAKYKKSYDDTDIIYAGDMNLSSDNAHLSWQADKNGFEIFIDKPTSITPHRYNQDGDETYGKSSNYDHFMLDRVATRECETQKGKIETRIFDFVKGDIFKKINKEYIIRTNSKALDLSTFPETDEPVDYNMKSSAKYTIKKKLSELEEKLNARKTIKNNKIVKDTYKFNSRKKSFVRRVFTEQLFDDSFYKIFVELISDHYPIELNCRNNVSFD